MGELRPSLPCLLHTQWKEWDLSSRLELGREANYKKKALANPFRLRNNNQLKVPRRDFNDGLVYTDPQKRL